MKTELRRVYIADGCNRAFLTKKAAALRQAKVSYLRKYRCDCERPRYTEDEAYPGYDCGCHSDRAIATRQRLARFILRAFKAAGAAGGCGEEKSFAS